MIQVTVTERDVRTARELCERMSDPGFTRPYLRAISRTLNAYFARIVADGVYVEYPDSTRTLFYTTSSLWDVADRMSDQQVGCSFELATYRDLH